MKKFFALFIVFYVAIGANAGCGVKRAPSPLYSTPLPFEEDSLILRPSASPSPTASPNKGKT